MRTIIQWLRERVDQLERDVAQIRQELQAPAPAEANSRPKPKNPVVQHRPRKSKPSPKRRPCSEAQRQEIADAFLDTAAKHQKWTAWRCAGVVARRVKRAHSFVRSICIEKGVYEYVNQERGNRYLEPKTVEPKT